MDVGGGGSGVPSRPRDRFGRQYARRGVAGRAARACRLRRRRRRPRRPRDGGRSAPPADAARASCADGDRRPAHPPRPRRAGPPPGRQPPASQRPPRLGRRRAPVRARDPRLPAAAASTAASAPARAAPSAACRPSPACPPTASPARPRSPPSPRPPVRPHALRRPIAAAVGDRYGPRGASFHAGLDFPADTGTAVTAAAAGRVAFAGYDDGWGLTIVLDHGNAVRTRYAHLSATLVSPGASVAAGTLRRPRRLHRRRHRPPPALRSHHQRSQRGPTLFLRNLRGLAPLAAL